MSRHDGPGILEADRALDAALAQIAQHAGQPAHETEQHALPYRDLNTGDGQHNAPDRHRHDETGDEALPALLRRGARSQLVLSEAGAEHIRASIVEPDAREDDEHDDDGCRRSIRMRQRG